MPSYDFVCDECGHTKEITCSMSEISDLRTPCPKCIKLTHLSAGPDGITPGIEGPAMRRIFGRAGVVFKGSFPGQDIKREKLDSDTQRQRRKACVLKDRGDVPQDHVLRLKESDARFDKKYSDNKLDKLYKESGGIVDK